MQDDKLLAQYARDGSEAAFGQIVARHLSLVYSTCLRETGSPSQAEDAAQVVFLLLARKAKSLRVGPSLAGWLYKAARFVAKDVCKQEVRRHLREERVMQEVMHGQEAFAPEWEGVEPLLNNALSALKPGERECVLLRFIEGHSLAETGAALGLSEDAARMRVSRAVEKMHHYLTSHGATITGLILIDFLNLEAAQPIPAHATNVITQGTLQALSTGPNANVLPLSKGVCHTMKMAQMKIAALATVLMLGGTSLPPLARAFNPHKSSVQVPVAPAPLTEPVSPAAGTKTIVLQHTTPVSILNLMHWDHPANLPTGVTQIRSLPAQNALTVVATPAGLARVQEIVKILDIEPRQVQIKYALARASDADLKASGIKFEPAPHIEPGLNPVSVKSGSGDLAAHFLKTLAEQRAVTLEPVITTTDNVAASISVSSTSPAQEVELLTLAATPRVNGDDSVTLTLHPSFSISKVTREISTFRTVKNGDTVVIAMPPAASQTDRKNVLLFVTPTVKAR